MKTLVLIAGLLTALTAGADGGTVPAGSAKATVQIQLIIPPRGESPSELRECAGSLAQQVRGEQGFFGDRCKQSFEVALVSTPDDLRRRIVPI